MWKQEECKESGENIKIWTKEGEVKAMDKITKDLEDPARRHKSKILSWDINKLRGSSQNRLVPVKNRNGAAINDKERARERWAEDFENILNQNRVIGIDIEENEEVCNSLDVKEDLFLKKN